MSTIDRVFYQETIWYTHVNYSPLLYAINHPNLPLGVVENVVHLRHHLRKDRSSDKR